MDLVEARDSLLSHVQGHLDGLFPSLLFTAEKQPWCHISLLGLPFSGGPPKVGLG